MKINFKFLYKCQNKSHSVPGFTLIELSIVMIIIGIMMASVFKGQELIESARLQSTFSEFNRLKLLVLQYREQFGAWPGNDRQAQGRFGGNISSGDGKGIILETEGANVWKHLCAAGLVDQDGAPPAKIGGVFSLRGAPAGLKGNWIVLSGEAGTLHPILTPKQAMVLKSKMDELDPTKGKIRIINGEGDGNNCVTGTTYNLQKDSQACVALMLVG
jgi:prepilin-type N-terminal cleavage/methylation domain-containing protein